MSVCKEESVAKQKTIKEKDATIITMRCNNDKGMITLSNEEPFVSKSRKNAKDETELTRCQVPGCEKENIDLAKCSKCRNLGCEDCFGIKVAKIRPVMNSCNKLYMTCPTCDLLIKDKNYTVVDKLNEKVKEPKESFKITGERIRT